MQTSRIHNLLKIAQTLMVGLFLTNSAFAAEEDPKGEPPGDPEPPNCCPNAVPIFTIPSPDGKTEPVTVGIQLPVWLGDDLCLEYTPGMVFAVTAQGGFDHDVCLDENGNYAGYYGVPIEYDFDGGGLRGAPHPGIPSQFVITPRDPNSNCRTYTVAVTVNDSGPCNAGSESVTDTVQVTLWKRYDITKQDRTSAIWLARAYAGPPTFLAVHITCYSTYTIINNDMQLKSQSAVYSLPTIPPATTHLRPVFTVTGSHSSYRNLAGVQAVDGTVALLAGTALLPPQTGSIGGAQTTYYTAGMIAAAQNQIFSKFELTAAMVIGTTINAKQKVVTIPIPHPGGCC